MDEKNKEGITILILNCQRMKLRNLRASRLIRLIHLIRVFRPWTVVELGMPMVDLARKFDITPAAVRYAVQRGKKMAKERGFQLEN